MPNTAVIGSGTGTSRNLGGISSGASSSGPFHGSASNNEQLVLRNDQ